MIALKRTRRILSRLILVMLIASVIFTTAAIIILNRYGKEVRDFTIEQINQQLETKIAVNNIDFSFFSGFPYLSIVFSDVTALSGMDFDPADFVNTPADTLFRSQKIYLQFNIFDILRGKYRIRRIHASGGNLNLLVDSHGKTNFRLFRQKKNRESKSKGFELEAVKLDDFDVSFINLAKNIEGQGYIGNVLFRGKFSDRNFAMGTVAELNINSFRRDGVNYADHFGITARVIFGVKDSLAIIQKGELNINNLKMNVKGQFTLGEISRTDLTLQGRNFDLHSLQSALPQPQRSEIPVDFYGKGDIAFRVKGNFSRLEVPSINGVYFLNVSRVKYHEQSFHNIRIKGRFSNGEKRSPVSTLIDIEEYTISDYRTSLNGQFRIENLKNPHLLLTIKGEADAEGLSGLFPEGKASGFEGMLRPDFRLETRLTSWHIENAERILSSGLNGKIELRDFGFTLDEKYPFSNITGNIELRGDTWLPDLDMVSGQSRLAMKLEMAHVFRFLMDKSSTMWVTGNINAGRMDLTPFLQPGKNETGIFSFPSRLYARIILNTDSITAKKFIAFDTDAFLQYKPGLLSLTSVRMRSMDGTISGSGMVMQDGDKNLFLRTQSDVDHLDIHTMFADLNNFTQDFIVSENLRGYLSGNIDFSTAFDSMLNMSSKDTEADATITITKGELIDFEPVESLAKFVALEELKHIRFSKLQNHIVIRDRIVTVPNMDIESSAFNISISGTHNFDNQFDYKLKVNLPDILAGKAKAARKDNEEFGVMEADGRRMNLYLSIIGTPDDYKIHYDKKEAILSIKQDFKEEKGRLRNLLNEEFGWFGKDTTQHDLNAKTSDPKFILEWDEGAPATRGVTESGSHGTKVRKDKFKIEWDEDDNDK